MAEKKENKEVQTVVENSEYQGKPVLKIFEIRPDGARRDYASLSFGVQKAKAILASIEAIKYFVEENS